MKISYIKIVVSIALALIISQQGSYAQVDRIYISKELEKCTMASGVLSSEVKAQENAVNLKYEYWNAIIKIFKENGKDPKTKTRYAKHKMTFKYTIPKGDKVFDDIKDRSEIMYFITERMNGLDLAMMPFLTDALYYLSDDIERGKNITKEPNGYNVINKKIPYDGTIKLMVRYGKGGGVLVYLEYEAKIS